MKKTWAALAVAGFLLGGLLARAAEPGFDKAGCSFKGHKLYGKIKIVESFPDVKIKVVDSFPDLKVKQVSNFADGCGKWQIVDNFADTKVQFVENFPDVKVKYVDSFPGVN